MCYDEGKLQEFIDNHLSRKEKLEIKKHLMICNKCRKLYNELKLTNQFVTSKMHSLMNLNQNQNYKGGLFDMILKHKKVAISVAIVILFSISVIFTPFGKALSNALKIFRAKSVEPIALSITDFQDIESKLKELNSNSTIDLKQLGKINVESSKAKNLNISSLDDENISQFKNLISSYAINSDSLIYIWQKAKIDRMTISVLEQPKTKLDFTLNVNKTNQLLKALGSNVLLPNELDNKTFSLNIEGALNISMLIPNTENQKYPGTNYLGIEIAKKPKLIAPVELDEKKLFEAVANLPFISKELKSQILSIKDPTATLPIPVDKENCNYKKISISGYEGLLVSAKNNPNSNYIVWVDNSDNVKMIYSHILSQEELIKIANSLE